MTHRPLIPMITNPLEGLAKATNEVIERRRRQALDALAEAGGALLDNALEVCAAQREIARCAEALASDLIRTLENLASDNPTPQGVGQSNLWLRLNKAETEFSVRRRLAPSGGHE